MYIFYFYRKKTFYVFYNVQYRVWKRQREINFKQDIICELYYVKLSWNDGVCFIKTVVAKYRSKYFFVLLHAIKIKYYI